MFAIVDVETTGGHASGHGLTEVAIVLHDGVKQHGSYTTLLNPGQPIPLNIQALTGITPEMVARAPKFSEKAKEILTFLGDAVFVAHNVNFDYSFMKAAFASCGIDYNPKRMCSVRYARRIEKGLKSYSLANLCKHFKIKNEAAHRAWGDASATAQIMEILLGKDTGGQWQHLIKKNSGEFNLPANLPSEEYKALPETPGVYYFMDQEGKPLYIGKAKNLKKRVASHFITDTESKKSQGFKREIYHVDFELTGSELLAILLEDHEIRHHWPKYNRAQKKPKKKFGLFTYKSVSGNWHLAVNRLSTQHGFVAEFYSQQEATSKALQLVKEFELNPTFCGFPLLNFGKQVAVNHNDGFEQMLQHLSEKEETLLIKTSGRTAEEDGFAYILDGNFGGIGFVPKEAEIKEISQVLPYLKKLRSSITTKAILDKVLTSNKHQVVKLMCA